MKYFKSILIILILGILEASFIKYQDRGPAEKAGEQLDKAVQDVSKKADDLLKK